MQYNTIQYNTKQRNIIQYIILFAKVKYLVSAEHVPGYLLVFDLINLFIVDSLVSVTDNCLITGVTFKVEGNGYSGLGQTK